MALFRALHRSLIMGQPLRKYLTEEMSLLQVSELEQSSLSSSLATSMSTSATRSGAWFSEAASALAVVSPCNAGEQLHLLLSF